MPSSVERRRGGAMRYRTVRTKKGKGFFRVAIVRKRGPRGGRTVAGQVHEYKKQHRRRSIG